MHLFTEEVIKIESIVDIELAIHTILSNLDKEYNVKIDLAEHLIFGFMGGRFDEVFVPVEAVETINTLHVEYKKYFSELIGGEIDDKELLIHIKHGSFVQEVFGKIPKEIYEKLAEKMESKHLTIILLIGVLAWFSDDAYKHTVDATIEKVKMDLEAKKIELEKEEKNDALGLVSKALEVVENTVAPEMHNPSLEKSKNKPVKKALEVIDDNEILEYGSGARKSAYKKSDAKKFDYIEPESQIIYEDLVLPFVVKQITRKKGAIYIKIRHGSTGDIEAVAKLSDSDLQSLVEPLKEGKEIVMKVKVGRIDGKIKDADIYEIIRK